VLSVPEEVGIERLRGRVANLAQGLDLSSRLRLAGVQQGETAWRQIKQVCGHDVFLLKLQTFSPEIAHGVSCFSKKWHALPKPLPRKG
jgi:hypothetical protein